MSRRDAIALLAVLVLPGLFVVYEMAALTGLAPWHTISWYAHAYAWVDWLVTGVAVAAPAAFLAWWRAHVKGKIPR